MVVSLATADGEALLTVSDDGIGFAPALAESLFEVFTRAAPTGTTAVSGLGLGLAIVRTISELHGGTVSAHSDGPGTGARVPRPAAAGQRLRSGRSAGDVPPPTGTRCGSW